MRPSKHLKQLHCKAVRRLNKLRVLVDQATALGWPESDRAVSYVTIECLNTWAGFVRAYFLSCTLSPVRENGCRIVLSNASIRTFGSAIDAAMRRCKPTIPGKRKWNRQDEPPWYKPATLIESCDEIGCSNYNDILGAFSLQTYVFRHLPRFRNFYAHRNDDTITSLKKLDLRYSIPRYRHPTEILLTQAYGRRQALLLDWIDDIKLTVEWLCT